jgi:hypothetical protein
MQACGPEGLVRSNSWTLRGVLPDKLWVRRNSSNLGKYRDLSRYAHHCFSCVMFQGAVQGTASILVSGQGKDEIPLALHHRSSVSGRHRRCLPPPSVSVRIAAMGREKNGNRSNIGLPPLECDVLPLSTDKSCASSSLCCLRYRCLTRLTPQR